MKKLFANKELKKYLFLVFVPISIIFFLYFKTQTIDINKHNQLRDLFSEFRQIDTNLNQHILEIRQNLITNYDVTSQSINKLKQIIAPAKDLLNNVNLNLNVKNKQKLTQKILEIQKVLIEKQNSIEQFKSKNAILRNSLLYLPIATSKMSQQLSNHKSVIHSLKHTLNNLLRTALIYIIDNDSSLLPSIEKMISILQKGFEKTSGPQQRNMQNILIHFKIVLSNKSQVDSLTQRIINSPLTQPLNQLQATYNIFYNKQLKTTNLYRQLLVAMSIFLLVSVAYILFRLNQTRIHLRHTVNDLNYQKFAMDQHAIVSITDKDGRITYANQKFCDISQRTLKELLGQNHRISKSGFHSKSFYQDLWGTITQGNVWHEQICNISKEGKTYWADTTIVPFMDENANPYQYVAIRTDITELKKTEERLHIQATALETAANGIVITDRNGLIEWSNNATTKISGFSEKELINQTPRIFKSEKHDDAFYIDMWQTIIAGKIWHGEVINKHKDGHIYTEEQTISPVFDEQKNIIRFITIKQDISERKLQDEKLRHSQKMDALGKLTGGIAHDYNNMLGVVLGYAELLKDSLQTQPAELTNYVEQIYHAAERGAKLTSKLLSFSRHHHSSAEKVNINKVLLDNQNMLEKILTTRIQLNLTVANEDWYSWIDSSDLEDAIINMCINSMHAIDGSGQIKIKISNVCITAHEALHLEIKTGDYILLSITDTGCGMSTETKEKIFDPFYSTKGENGTGLGLSQVYGFVERCGGVIKVYSEPNCGTQIVTYFPRHLENKESIQEKESKQAHLQGSETILIVEDEPALLNLVTKILTSQGYNVFSAADAKQALEILSKENIQLMLSDVIMPNMDGYELATLVSNKYPKVKIQLASGFNEHPQLNSIDEELNKNLLQKPYDSNKLLQRLRTLLDKNKV